MDDYVGKMDKPAGGWRIEKTPGREEEDDDECVLFAGWKSVEEHSGFATTENCEKDERIRDFVHGFQVKHGTRIEV